MRSYFMNMYCTFIALKLSIKNSTSSASQLLFNVLLFQSSVCRRKHCLMLSWRCQTESWLCDCYRVLLFVFLGNVSQSWLCNCYRVLLFVFLGNVRQSWLSNCYRVLLFVLLDNVRQGHGCVIVTGCCILGS